MDKSKFNSVVALVIDNLEGGYYHPDMLKDGRIKDSRYSDSGETMLGIDRKAGGALNTTTAGKAFWGAIDAAGARTKWKWNYKGGQLYDKLKGLAADIIYPEYERLAGLYLSPEAKKIVDQDKRLLFHFVYGTWNGAGWFKKFASDINNAVSGGVVNPVTLTKVAIDSRTKEGLKKGSSPNSLIAQGGQKIAKLFMNDLPEIVKETASGVKNNSGTILLLLGAGAVVYVITK